MKKIFLLSATILCLLGVSGCRKPAPVAEKLSVHDLLTMKSKVIRDLSIQSTYMGATMKYSVYLPPRFDENKEYPVLYLLHGSGDNQNSWLDKGSMQNIADKYMNGSGTHMIIVMPDAQQTFYMNAFEQYFFGELVPKVEADYKTTGKRAVAGLSMGGFGTLYYIIGHADKFTYGYAMSPAVSLAMVDMITDPSALPGLTIETGEEDTTTPKDGIDAFVEALTAKGVNVEYITRTGKHAWDFWSACLPKALKKAGESFK